MYENCTIKCDYWQGCYDEGWRGLIVPEAFSHPAKFSRGLVFRIIKYALEEGLIQPGGVVFDPFGGVSLGALPCLQNGLHWVGVELEEKFVELGRANIRLWNERFSPHFPRWGSAQLLQGDSRCLVEIIGKAGLVVGSPPYAQVFEGQADKQTRAKREERAKGRLGGGQINYDRNYGSTPGQLATLPPGDVQAVVSSPPFAGNTGGRGEASRNGIDAALFDRHSGGMKRGTGSNPANLDHLPMGQMAVMQSPPFEDTAPIHDKNFRINDGRRALPQGQEGYGSTPGQIGQESGETFWSAAGLIVNQCASILPTGGAAIWVVKDYVKAGKIVPFSEQWRALCEAAGFETVEVIRAWVVKRRGSQATLDGGAISLDIERKSFFRRLAERKGAPRIDWETVLVTRRLPQ